MPRFSRALGAILLRSATVEGGGDPAPATPPADPPAAEPRFFALEARPEGLADAHWLEGKGLNVDALLATAGKDHRAELLAELREGVPEKPEGYEFKPDPAKTKGATVDLADPVLAKAREVMHRLGAKPADWSELTEAYVAAAVAAMPDVQGEIAKLGEGGQARLTALDMKLAKALPEGQYRALMHGITTAEGIQALEKLLGAAPAAGGDKPLVPGGMGGGGSNGLVSPEEAAQLVAHPSYHKSNPEGAALRAKFSAFVQAGGVLPGFRVR